MVHARSFLLRPNLTFSCRNSTLSYLRENLLPTRHHCPALVTMPISQPSAINLHRGLETEFCTFWFLVTAGWSMYLRCVVYTTALPNSKTMNI
jgi:hypothetical protein